MQTMRRKKIWPKKVWFTFLTSPIYLAPLAKMFDLVVVVFVVVGGGGGGGGGGEGGGYGAI